MPAPPVTPDKPLNARQELFVQALASGMSQRDACTAAGYKDRKSAWIILSRANVAARFAQVTAEMAATKRVTRAGISDRMLGIAERNETADSVTAQGLALRALNTVAKMHGLQTPKPPPPVAPAPPAREPVTEIIRSIVYPDGYATDYNGNPLDPDRPPYDPGFRYRPGDKET